MDKRILILTLKIGGVISIAQSMQEYFEAKGYSVKLCYVEDAVNQNVYSFLFKGWYLKPIPKAIKLWSFLYNNSFVYRIAYSVLYLTKPSFTCNVLQNEIERFKPNEIIAGSFLPSFFIRHAVKNINIKCKLNAVISNFDFPKYWDKHLDNYFIPHSGLIQIGIRNGIAKNKIHVSGLPIILSLESKYARRKQLLFVGGRLGIGIKRDTILLLLKHTDYSINVVCAENLTLNEELSKIINPRLIVLGNIEAKLMTKLYRESQCVITKAGTLTVAEAAICKTPIIINYHVEGHEKKNVQYLKKHKACLFGYTNNELLDSLNVLNEQGDVYKEIVDNAYNLLKKSKNIDFSPILNRN